MSVLVREEWYTFFKKCEKNLEKIKKILQNKDFQNFYDESDKEQSDHWQDFIIPIFDNANITKEKTNESKILVTK